MAFAFVTLFALVLMTLLALMAAALALLGREILAMEAFLEFLLRGGTDGLNAAAEVEGLAGHRMVEVHHHVVCGNFLYGALHNLAGAVKHGEGAADDQKVCDHLALYLEGLDGDGDKVTGVVHPVAVFRAEREGAVVPGLFLLEGSLELGKEHPGTVNILKGCVGGRFVCECSVDMEFVADCYYMVFFNFHFRCNKVQS